MQKNEEARAKRMIRADEAASNKRTKTRKKTPG